MRLTMKIGFCILAIRFLAKARIFEGKDGFADILQS